MALSSAPTSLARMEHDPETRLVDFFTAWNADLPPTAVAINDKICHRFREKHGRARFSALFKLSRAEAEEVVSFAGGADGWLKTIEDLAGFKFDAPTAPTSGHLASLSSGVAEPMKRKAVPTLSDEVSDWAAEIVPDHCYSAVKCANPGSDPLSEPDIQAFTDALLGWVLATRGALNLGAPLTRHYAAQVGVRFPFLPDYGCTAGSSRTWFKIIKEKAKNRTHKPYAKKLSINVIDLSTDIETFKASRMAALVDLDEAATEPKFVQKALDNAKVDEAARAAETESGMYCAAASDSVTMDFGPADDPVPAAESASVTTDFGGAAPVPASGSPLPSAQVVTEETTGRGPLQVLSLSKQQPSAKTPANTAAGSSKRRSRAPASGQVSEYEAARNANVQKNMEFLKSLGLEQGPVLKKPRTKPAFVRRALSKTEAEALPVVCSASVLTQANLVGAVLAIPQSFFTYTEKEPDFWGYIATVQQKVLRSDYPAFSLKFHDCTTPFYLEQHPNYTQEEKEAGVPVRYLQNPDVKVLQLGRAS